MVLVSDAYPHPADVYRGFSDESEYVDWLKKQFERFGWSTWTEVSSRDSKARADLVIRKEPWGSIGIEVKYSDQLTPRYWSEALRQIHEYEKKSFGLDINSWAVAGDQLRLDGERADRFRTKKELYKEFFNYLGYGFVRTTRKIAIEYNNSNPLVKIPIAKIHYKRGDIQPPSEQTYKKQQTQKAIEYLKCQTGGVLA